MEMPDKMKKFLSITLSAVMALSLAGCQEDIPKIIEFLEKQ